MTDRDPRQYARIAVDLPSNRKLAGASPQAKWLAVTAVLFSVQNLTDGQVVPSVVCALSKVGNRHVSELVNRDVWHAKGHVCPDCPQPDTADGVVIHDYLAHQDSAEEVRQARYEKAQASRLGNHTRWHHSGPVEECRRCNR